jgi:pimeloyl-ACP methyl ester carboxylesterase
MTLCLLYWQGSWQLLYHPKPAVTSTPASAGLSYQPVRFGAIETGQPQLTGWWIPAGDSVQNSGTRTVLYLHGADGNLGDTVETLAALHAESLSVFAFDYRGYGQSQPGKPSEERLRQDAEWAWIWLTGTQHVPATSIVLMGSGLGANLAAAMAAGHNEMAGVILDGPSENTMGPVFGDPRSRLVPARWLVADRYDLPAAAAGLHIPSLWLLGKTSRRDTLPAAYALDNGSKSSAFLYPPVAHDPHFAETLRRWLDDLPKAQ